MGLVAASAFSFAAVSCMNYMGKKSANYIDMKTLELVQKETPENDDPVAVIKTSMGDIKAALYPDSDFMGEGYLCFVLKSRTQDANDPDFGKLVFSKSYEDFLKNKEAYKNS